MWNSKCGSLRSGFFVFNVKLYNMYWNIMGLIGFLFYWEFFSIYMKVYCFLLDILF